MLPVHWLSKRNLRSSLAYKKYRSRLFLLLSDLGTCSIDDVVERLLRSAVIQISDPGELHLRDVVTFVYGPSFVVRKNATETTRKKKRNRMQTYQIVTIIMTKERAKLKGLARERIYD